MRDKLRPPEQDPFSHPFTSSTVATHSPYENVGTVYGRVYPLRLTLHLARVPRDSSTRGAWNQRPGSRYGVTESDGLTCGCPCKALVEIC